MNAHWAQYMLNVEGQPASCVIDLSYGETGRDEELPVCTLVRVPFQTASDDGFGDADEVERLHEFEDQTLTPAAATLGLVLVATVRGGGQLDFWFYGPADHAEELLDAAADALEGYEVQGGSQDDPEWEQYFDVLFPDQQGLRQIADQQVLMALLDAGDDGHTPRAIEHMAVFESKEAADDFAAKLKEEGFRIDGVGEHLSEEEGGGKQWQVEFSNESPAEIAHILPITTHLDELAEACGGSYDGWQTQVISGSESA